MSQDDTNPPSGSTPPPYQASVPPPPQDPTPQYQTPPYQAPTGQPGQQAPQQPGYQQPGYQQPGYQQPGYQQPPYQQGGYQQGAYQQGQYPQAQYQAGYPAGQPSRTNGLAIAALVVGIISLLLSFIPFVNIAAILGGIAALVLGFLGLRKAKEGTVGGRGMSITGLVLGVVSVLISIAVLVATVVALNNLPGELGEVIEEAENGGLSPEEQAEASANALSLGESAEVGDYTVTVTEVTQDATDIIAAENEFNTEAEGQYVMVGLEVVYTGSNEGTPWIDLPVTYMGTDNRQYDTSTCFASIPESAMEVPTLNNGGAAQYNVCMDVPADAIAGGQVTVEELISFTNSRVYWDVE